MTEKHSKCVLKLFKAVSFIVQRFLKRVGKSKGVNLKFFVDFGYFSNFIKIIQKSFKTLQMRLKTL
jgi:hypothetical protein